MYLVFDGVSSDGYLGVYHEDFSCEAETRFAIAGNESSQAIPLIGDFLSEQNISYEDITEIFCVIGPGSFTGIRTLTLIVNTLAYIYPHIRLTGISFFDIYDSYPIVKQSSKRDVFVKTQKTATIKIWQNQKLKEGYEGKKVFGDILPELATYFTLDSTRDYQKLLKNTPKQSLNRLVPLYIKKPNIS